MPTSASAQALSARARRITRQEETARRFAASLEAHGVTRAAVAAEIGCTPQLVSDYTVDEAEANLSVADARGISSADVRRDLMDAIGGADLVAVRRHAAAEHALTVPAAANMLRASSCVVDTMLSALADGHVDPAERRDLLRKLDALLCDAEGLRTALIAHEVKPAAKPLRAL